MSSKIDSWELHGDEGEFFPDHGYIRDTGIPSVKKNEKQKKSLVTQHMAAAAAAVVLVSVAAPYVLCHPRSIEKNTASLYSEVMNMREDLKVSYLVQEYPGMPYTAVRDAIAADPDQGTPFPADGSLILEGLEPRTIYKLIFYAEDLGKPEEAPGILGEYTFQTGELPVPTVLREVQNLIRPPVPDTPPEPPQPPAVPEETPAPTTAPTVVTEETTMPTEPPTEAPTEPPTELPTEPPTQPPAPEPVPDLPPVPPIPDLPPVTNPPDFEFIPHLPPDIMPPTEAPTEAPIWP